MPLKRRSDMRLTVVEADQDRVRKRTSLCSCPEHGRVGSRLSEDSCFGRVRTKFQMQSRLRVECQLQVKYAFLQLKSIGTFLRVGRPVLRIFQYFNNHLSWDPSSAAKEYKV